MSEIQSVSLDDARFELPVAENNLPRPLLQVPNLDDSEKQSSRPPALPAKHSEDTGPKIEEPVRRFQKVIAVLQQPGDWWRMVHAGRHALMLGGMAVLLVAAFLLISGNGGPELDEPEPIADGVEPQIPVAQPEVKWDDGLAVDLVHEPLTMPEIELEPLGAGDQTNSLAKKTQEADSAGARLLAPNLGGQFTGQQPAAKDHRLAKANQLIEPPQRQGDFKPTAPSVEAPPARSESQLADRSPVRSRQPTDWRFQNYPETNPQNFEYPSNTAPGWRLARQMQDSRVDPPARRDGNWGDSRDNQQQDYRNYRPSRRGNP